MSQTLNQRLLLGGRGKTGSISSGIQEASATTTIAAIVQLTHRFWKYKHQIIPSLVATTATPRLYNVATGSRHTDTTIEQTRDAVILMAKTYMGVEDKVDGIAIVIDSGVIDYCFVDFSAFTEYKKFDVPVIAKS